jgi:hypothetical protein
MSKKILKNRNLGLLKFLPRAKAKLVILLKISQKASHRKILNTVGGKVLWRVGMVALVKREMRIIK